jgi:hypothetical protein
MVQNSSSKADNRTTVINFTALYVNQNLLSWSQDPDNGPYPEPLEHSPRPHCLFFFKSTFTSPHLGLSLQSDLFPHRI